MRAVPITHSPEALRPSAFTVRPLSDPPLTIQLTTAISSLRPTTLTQQATLALITEVAGECLIP